jgi:ubiquinone/menaquinone biosynthesis C-methylase UbiE
MQDITSNRTGNFFEGYAYQFDEIYVIQHQKGLRGWLNRSLRASMETRYRNTFASLQPMEGRTVLDIGCGSGRYIFDCLESGAARVTGIDLSEEMIVLTNRALRNCGDVSDRVELIVGDFFKQDFRRTYDYAIVMGVMDYIEDAEGFLRKLNRLVTCRTVLSFPVAESAWTLQRKVRYMVRHCPLYFYSQERLQHLMQGANVRTFSVQRIDRDYFVIAEP